jgi:nucleosome-remodeling factor subunit BPTF
MTKTKKVFKHPLKAAEEQSNLLSEIHIALLKAIIRAEEKDNTTFAPLDQKDSVNCLFFFMDSFSWPEGLRSYLSSDPVTYEEPLKVNQ